MFLPVGLAVLPEIVALNNAHFQLHLNFADSEVHRLRNIAPARRPLEVPSIANPTGVILKEQQVYLSPAYPQGGLRQEWNSSQLDLPTFLLCMAHILAELVVKLVELSCYFPP